MSSPRDSLCSLVKRGPNAGSTFLLKDEETTVGRDTGSDDLPRRRDRVRAGTPPCSGATTGWFVVDSGSLNGTYVNGEQVDETKLATGDELQIGKFKLTFFAAE